MLRGAIFGLSATAIWGGLYVVADVVLLTIPPFTLLTIRLLIGIVVLGVFVLPRAEARQLARPDVLRLVGVGMIGFGISVGMQFVGTDKSTAVNGALVTSASPAFILIFATLILHEKLTLRRIAAVGLATLGVVVIVNPANANFSSSSFAGDLALAVAALTWGLYSVLVRRVSARIDTLLVTVYALAGGLIVAVPAMILELTKRSIGHIDLGVIAGVLYLGIIATAVSMWMWNRAFALVDASTAALFFFDQPLVGSVLSVIFLGQRMTLNLWTGGLLIGLGVLLSLLRSQSTSPDISRPV